jgi:hypothetical protein
MNLRLRDLALAICGTIALGLSGCVSPAPQAFVDADALPSDFAGREYRAFARDQRLIIEVSQTPGLNVAGFESFEHDGAVYVSPRHISSGGGGKAQFEVDLSKYHLEADWPDHVYWVLESYSYPIGNPGFWSSAKRSPWPRKKMEIARPILLRQSPAARPPCV